MILTDENGNQIDYFERFPNNIKSIGISLSGGVDSALILYLLAKMIKDRNQISYIYPIHGYDISRKNVHSYTTAERVVNVIKYELNDWSIIQPLYVFAYDKNLPISKEEYHKANYEYMKRRYGIPFIIRGVTQGMPDSGRPLVEGDATSDELHHYANTTWSFPFGSVDKKYIANQYKTFGLDILYSVTSSCISDSPKPCKKCWWCKEKYWAFGSYDGGIQ